MLRGWPFGDPDEAESQIEAIRSIVTRSDVSEFLDVEDPGIETAYAIWSETYDEIANALIEVEEPAIRTIVSELAPGRAADVACGTGRITAILADLGHNVLGVDPSAEMLERARAKGIRAKFVRGDLRHLPMLDDSVDLLTCGLALTHVTELAEAIDELARVVRPGGLVVLSDVHPLSVATGGQALFRAADGSRGVAHNEQHWTSAYVNSFVAAGLHVERCEEPVIDEAFGELLEPGLRGAVRAAVVGLPFALVWVLRKPQGLV